MYYTQYYALKNDEYNNLLEKMPYSHRHRDLYKDTIIKFYTKVYVIMSEL